MATIQKIIPCLWFDTQAEEAANFYVSVFENSKILHVLHYSEAGHEIHGKAAGTVLTVVFEISGQRFTALNGGPQFKFSEAISLEVNCEAQQEIDYLWENLSEGGEEGACGWLKDRYGLSWQITPTVLGEMLRNPNIEVTQRVTNSFLRMKKLIIRELEQAFRGD